MTSKGFTENTKNIETPNDINVTEKPLNSNKISSGRVDINVLLNRVKSHKKQEIKNKFYFSAAASTGLILFGLIVFS